MTNADQLRLNLIAGLTSSPQQAADRLVPADAARIEPTVTQPFDTIEEHLGSVYRYALRLTGRPDLAEDLTQETLLRGGAAGKSFANREPREFGYSGLLRTFGQTTYGAGGFVRSH